MRRALIALGVIGLVAGGVPLALALATPEGHQRTLIAIAGPITGWAFVGAGIYAWLRRPENRIGPLMTVVGFTACLASLRVATDPWVFITGLVFITVPYAVLYHLLLAFPDGRVGGWFERTLVVVGYLSVAAVHPFGVLFQDTAAQGLPANPLLITSDPDLVQSLSRFRFWLGLALIAALVMILARRWRAADATTRRRAFLPVIATGGIVIDLLAAWYVAQLAGAADWLTEALEEARVVLLAVVPFAFLAGVLQSRVASAAAVSELVARLGEPTRGGALRDALADALGDPSLALAYWIPQRGEHVDADGRRVEVPPVDLGRVCAPIERDGARVATIIHSASLAAGPELVRAVGAAAAITLENERLDAELRAKVEELRASRARIVESSDATRRRFERDLHDGAQQRLVSLALNMRLLRSRLEDTPELAGELDSARLELEQALDELRELARGLHPSVLTDRGLDAAVEGLARRAPVPVEVEVRVDDRLPERIESAAYFVVAEALTNVAKYARASHATVALRRSDGTLTVEVADDGVGGADIASGSGLRGLVDRVAALDGGLDVRSSPGAGTAVVATIPLEEHAAGG